ncbi:hypothetical protein Ae201684P_001284 [Aphanomyces euteiches]|nr:hypothetical protein Ae201684P_001284 [Aphanomyces euteiches]
MLPMDAPSEMTIFVRLCQRQANDKFTARVSSLATVETLQRFVVSQWQITKNPLKDVPLSQHIFSFQGRILRHDSHLDILATTTRITRSRRLRAEFAASAIGTRVQLLQRESRLERLQQATKRGLVEQAKAITQELKALERSNETMVEVRTVVMPPRPRSIRWPTPPSRHRTVFFSITELERQYQLIPRDVLEPALFLLDVEREWVFSRHHSVQKASFDYKYLAFDKDFVDLLVFKEEAQLVFWFQPDRSYEKLSAFLTKTIDPVVGKTYAPLTIEPNRWLALGGHDGWEGKVRRDGRRQTTRPIPVYTA